MASLDPKLAARIKAMPLKDRKAMRSRVKAKLDAQKRPMKAPPGAK